MSFEVKLPLFEGPFDLLLFFIERDELDIYDIPIAHITDDFLDYIRHLEHMNIEVASEFILVASTLMSIKAKMLLPRQELDEEGNEIDPREELVKHLLEYKKYKSVLDSIKQMEEDRMGMNKRGNVVSELKSIAPSISVESELQNLDMYKLLKTFGKMMDKYELRQNAPVHTIVKYPYTIEAQKTLITNWLAKKGSFGFVEIIEFYQEKVAIIFTFLAMLELIQLSVIKVQVRMGFNNFIIEKNEE